ncbi:hypothetical protein [Maricaulis sp.]|uniref:hypothetical protein n=1 Tax=Maricaulis sp. TaxID=1486257 RepID=UPI0026239FB2|nr:hypothetical protein [Maricaulis sp.]
MTKLGPWLAAARCLALILILANLVYAGRLLAAGFAGMAGVETVLAVDPVIVSALADDPAWKFVSRIALIAGYALLGYTLLFQRLWILPVAIPLFLVDQGLWLWATSQISNTLEHSQLDEQGRANAVLLDWAKFVVKNVIFVLSLSVAILSGPRDRRWLSAE